MEDQHYSAGQLAGLYRHYYMARHATDPSVRQQAEEELIEHTLYSRVLAEFNGQFESEGDMLTHFLSIVDPRERKTLSWRLALARVTVSPVCDENNSVDS